jgi:hypothetical protein
MLPRVVGGVARWGGAREALAEYPGVARCGRTGSGGGGWEESGEVGIVAVITCFTGRLFFPIVEVYK